MQNKKGSPQHGITFLGNCLHKTLNDGIVAKMGRPTGITLVKKGAWLLGIDFLQQLKG